MRDWFKNYTFVDYATQLYQAIVVGLILLFHNETVDSWALRAGAHIMVMLGIHWIVNLDARRPAARVGSFIRHFYPVLLYTWFFTETGALNRMFIAGYIDPVVIRWEQALFGYQPSVLFMEKAPYLIVSEIFYASYFSYYIMISGIGLALYLRNRSEFFHYVSVVSFVFYVCYLLYIFLPVIGPRAFFREIESYTLPDEIQQLAGPEPSYPAHLKVGPFYRIMAFIYKNFETPGAALPSSHVAVSLCTLFFSAKYLPKIRFFHGVAVLLLCASTVYCRYHYLVDVGTGCLTAAVLVPLGNLLYRKYRKPHLENVTPQQAREPTPV